MEKSIQHINTASGGTSHLLQGISSPADLRRLDVGQLPEVCHEIRDIIIDTLSVNPGHFASSMGAVDIIVALHYVFNTPRDRIVFDVGHQAYAHKILTGRRDALATQRTLNGISGFPTPSESEYDTFTCGHAGNAISAALGMAIADMNTPGEEDRNTVVLIGDASISNGLSFEGLNNASINPNNLLIILNDNDMSISPNVGALHRYLSEMTTSSGYNRWRYKLYNIFKNKGLINDSRKGRVLRFGNALKSLISQQQNIFEGLNIRYFGPFDGNDVSKVVKVLREIKEMRGPRILHLHTTKGAGYEPAVKNPSTWHAPGKFNKETGERMKSGAKTMKWQEVFGKTLLEMAREHDDITGITAAMSSGTSIDIMQKEMPDRIYDVGISEGHAVTFAGGLAAAGKRPYVAIYSSFLQRAYDNIIHDVAMQGLPVVFCIDRAGIVGEDGLTHHGMLDLVFMRSIPGMAVSAPSDSEMLRNLMITSYDMKSPMAIRYPRGNCGVINENVKPHAIQVGKGRTVIDTGADIAILTVGPMLDEALRAIEILAADGVKADLYDMIWISPLDTELLSHIAATHRHIVTVEDGMRSGGFGSAVEEWIADEGHNDLRVTRLGIPDKWVAHGSIKELRHICGYDAESIANICKQ